MNRRHYIDGNSSFTCSARSAFISIYLHLIPSVSLNILLYRNVLVYVFAADEGVEEDICQHGDYQPIAGDVANIEGKHVMLDVRHDTTANNKYHKDT